MKKLFIIIVFVLCSLHISSAQCSYLSPYSSTTTVYTPTNLPVTAGVFNGTDITYTSSDVALWTSELSQLYGAVYMGPKTRTYNCHGYTFSVSEGGSTVWINQGCLNPYFSNNSGYVETKNESEAIKVYYNPAGDHSAIRLDSWWYQSKWGYSFLVKHPPNAVDSDYQASKTKTYWKSPFIMSGPSTIYSGSTANYYMTYIPGATYSWSPTYFLLMTSGNGGSSATFYAPYTPTLEKDVVECAVTINGVTKYGYIRVDIR